MVETRHQSASNLVNLRSPEPLEEGEVLPTPAIYQSEERIAEALKLLNSSASTLGFTAEDIKAFLLHRSAEAQHQTESKPPNVFHPAVLDPSLSKTTENSVFDLRQRHALHWQPQHHNCETQHLHIFTLTWVKDVYNIHVYQGLGATSHTSCLQIGRAHV